MRKRTLCWLALVTLCSALHAALVANEIGAPQDLQHASGVDVCRGRSVFCSVLIDVPTRCIGASSTCPVLFCLHGFGGNASRYAEQCGPGVHSHTFIGVYPQGDPLAGTDAHPGGFGWNDGMSVNPKNSRLRCAYNNFTCTLDPNDGLFFQTIVEALRSAGAAGHLFAFGQSNGADWVQRLGSNAGPTLPFSGIAPQSGQMNARPPRSAAGPFNLNQPHLGGPPIAQLAIHGTDDATIAYDGGPKFHSPIFIMYSEPESDDMWAQHNGCTGGVVATNVSAKFSAVGPNHTHVSATGVSTHHIFGGCPATAPVEWYETHGAGHCGTSHLDGLPLVDVVLTFFGRVEAALALAAESESVLTGRGTRVKTDELSIRTPATRAVNTLRSAQAHQRVARSRVGDAWGTNIHWLHETALGEVAMLSKAFKLARIGFSWSEIESTKGQYNFSKYDGLHAILQTHGVRPYWILQRGNPLYASSLAAEKRGCNSSECLRAFGDFATAAAKHFGAKSQIVWECTNEPNGHIKLSDGSIAHAVGAATLVAQCSRAGIAFKRFGQLFVGPTTTAFDWEYINATLVDGLLSAVGGVSVHGYRTPNQVPETILSDWARLRHMIAQYGRSREEKLTPMISGEWGYTTARTPCSDPYRVSETLQASYLARAWLVNTLAGVPISIDYDWRDDGIIATSGEAHYGSVRVARIEANDSKAQPFEPKPKYNAALALQRGLGNFQFFAGRVRPLSAYPSSTPFDGIFVLRFENRSHDASAMDRPTAGFAVWTNGTIASNEKCGGDPENRVQCGGVGITRDECLSTTNPHCKGACWDPNETIPVSSSCYRDQVVQYPQVQLSFAVFNETVEGCWAVTDVFGTTQAPSPICARKIGSVSAVSLRISGSAPVYLLPLPAKL